MLKNVSFTFLFFLLPFSFTNAQKEYNRTNQERYFYSKLDSSRFFENQDFKKSLEFAEMAKSYADSIGVSEFQVKALIQSGRLYLKIGLIDLSADHYLKSISKLEQQKVKDYSDIIDAQIGLGGVYLFLGDLDKSQKIYEKTLFLIDSLKLQDHLSYSSIYNNLGIIYKERNELSDAFSILSKGIRMLLEVEPTNKNLPLLYNHLGDVYLRMKNFDEALISYQSSLAIRIRDNDLLGVAATYKNIGILYVLMEDPKNAIRFLREAYALGEELDALVVKHAVSSQLAEVYKTINRPDSSLYYLEAKNQHEQLLNKDKATQQLLAEEITVSYEKQYQVLEKQGKLKVRSYLYILFLLGIIIFMIIYFFYLLSKKHAKVSLEMINSQLDLDKLELEQQLLKAQLEEKNKKLTANLLYSVKRNGLIKDAVEKLVSHRKNFGKDGQEVIRGVLHDLNNSQEEKIFEEFEAAFLNLHQDFFENLLVAFPHLSVNEKRICAFIRLNLTTKEIASITGQALPSLQKAKIRLRKKLGLTNTDQDLYEFLAQF
jgi:tetratricopeptide (TPR) repeat protein